MKKDKKLDLKVEFKNELDIRVLDDSFYRELLNNIKKVKDEKENKDNGKNKQ